VISTHKQTNCKKKVQPCLKWPVRKKLWNQRGRLRNGCEWYRLMAKILIATVLVNFVLIPRSRQHKLTRIFAIKIFVISIRNYTITVISWSPPLISQLFSRWPFSCTFFKVSLFLSRLALFLILDSLFLPALAEPIHTRSSCFNKFPNLL